jgi:alkylation response protein AidB-like acyl-CoA dehydrogenase
MDLTFDADQEGFRAEARAWLAAHVPTEPLPPLGTPAGVGAHRAWDATLFADRWSVVHWPVEFGGRDAGLVRWLIFEEEYARARAPRRLSRAGISLAGAALLEHGRAAQKERFLPSMASGEEIWCGAWPEAGAHGDLAGVGGRAVRNAGGDGWVLSGPRAPVSQGAWAQWCLCIARREGDPVSRGGLSGFLVALDSPGVTTRPIAPTDGEAGVAEIHFDDVEVPDSHVLVDRGAGVGIGATIPGADHGLSLRSPAPLNEAAARLIDLFRQRGSPAWAADAVARAQVDAQATVLHALWTATKAAGGLDVGPEASCNEIFWSEADVTIRRTALALLGPEAELLDSGSPNTWLNGIDGINGIETGSHRLHHDVVADRLLGLPEG